VKRSEINKAIQTALQTLEEHKFRLPPFAHWTPQQWRIAGPECERLRANGLGWDITDFGSGDFAKMGAVLFTLRNGNHEQPDKGTPYAEKVIILTPGQRLPLHFHYAKTEDIINRGGGIMKMKLYNSLPDGGVDKTAPVRVFRDAIERTVQPGELIEIHPGASVTLTPRLHHLFWAHENGGVLICGEVSSVNDDLADNFFAEPVTRFAEIVEDEPPLRVLCNEYRDRSL
jgi:D-lyxose ketol-isomerase